MNLDPRVSYVCLTSVCAFLAAFSPLAPVWTPLPLLVTFGAVAGFDVCVTFIEMARGSEFPKWTLFHSLACFTGASINTIELLTRFLG